MKKFLLGLICGMALFAATAAAASNEVRALISNIAVAYHVGGETVQSGEADDIALNYKGQLYVPLRKFAETLGASVYYFKPEGGERAKVEVYAADDRDLPLADKDGYVRVGHLERTYHPYTSQKGTTYNSNPEVTGTVRFDKSIPYGMEVVFALVNKDGNQKEVSEPIKLRTLHNREMSLYQRIPGDLATFTASLPLLDNLDDYELVPLVMDKQDWTFLQYPVEACACGAGGMNGHPLAANINSGYPYSSREGTAALSVHLINFDDDRHVTLTKSISFEIKIMREGDTGNQVVRTLKTPPFEGTVYRMRGAQQALIEWDLKDGNGKAVSPGTYVAYLSLPITAEGHWENEPGTQTQFRLEYSMQAVDYVEMP